MDNVEMDQILDNVLYAIESIRLGTCKKVEVTDSIKVYEVKDTIRIDIKKEC